MNFSLIGNEKSSHYVIVGDPIWQVKSLQENIKAGEILVTIKAWFYAQESLYSYVYNRDLRFYKVENFKDNLGVAQRQQEATLNFYEMQRKMGKDELSSASVTLHDQSFDPFSLNELFKTDETFSCKSF